MSGAFLNETAVVEPPSSRPVSRKSPPVATAAEAMENYKGNGAGTWYEDDADAEDPAGRFAFQRLRKTWFTPQVDPRFKLRRDDKFYAIGSCFARGLEQFLSKHNIGVESAAPEFAKLQPAKRRVTALGFTNKYNTYSILNELRWALDPNATFPLQSIAQLTETTWYDPHTNPTLNFTSLEETLERRALMQTVTKRIRNCRVARCSNRCVRQLHSACRRIHAKAERSSLFVYTRTRSIRISSN
jgi:GSCFA family